VCFAVPFSANIVFDCRLDALIKLNHVIAGLYMYVFNFIHRKTFTDVRTQNKLSWETVLTAGFELDVLRGKISYRWTIWVGSLLTITGIQPPSHRKVAIPWNPLYPFIHLPLLLHRYRWPKSALSGKALILLGFRAEIIINAYPIAVHGSHFREDAVLMIVSLQFE
jgi:hypothetical protein